jgi:hypothetical protein
MRARGGDWSRYWAYPDEGVELLRARYAAHRYDPHIHETYAFGLVEGGGRRLRAAASGSIRPVGRSLRSIRAMRMTARRRMGEGSSIA